VSRDGLTLYVASNHGVTGVHVFYATRATTTAPFGARQLLFPNGAYDDWGVSVTSDGLGAVLSSDRSGNSQLYVTSRASTAAAFGALALAANTSSPKAEEGPRSPALDVPGGISADGCTLYMSSNRSDAGTKSDLYVARRPK
jgi:hypothetical protein